jgi:HrpA-like RNA helicase
VASSASDSAVDPVEQLLDLFLYAPIGLLSKGSEALPDLVQRGRTQASNARVIGQFALGASNTKARQSLSDAEAHLQAFLRIVTESARPSPTKSESADASSTASNNATSDASITGVDDLIENYDSLTAAQILPLLAPLPAEQLDRIEIHEQSQRARKTVLSRLRQLRS